jgi:hypothetical protein
MNPHEEILLLAPTSAIDFGLKKGSRLRFMANLPKKNSLNNF